MEVPLLDQLGLPAALMLFRMSLELVTTTFTAKPPEKREAPLATCVILDWSVVSLSAHSEKLEHRGNSIILRTNELKKGTCQHWIRYHADQNEFRVLGTFQEIEINVSYSE